MELEPSAPGMLEQLMFPAFVVKDGIVVQVNQAAQQRQIQPGTHVRELICVGLEDYERFTGGRLCLTLLICDIACNASVTAADGYHIFALDPDFDEPELRAFALAAQQLREPLSNAMVSTELLLPNDTIQKDPEAHLQLARVNRSLHQLLRAVCNMSDAASFKNQCTCRMEMRDTVSIFEEILEKASHLAHQAERTLNYRCTLQSVFSAVDAEKLERAVLNLISNALKFSPKGGTVNARLYRSGSRLIFTVEDSGQGIDPMLHSNIFSRYLRQPGIEDCRSGIGLGMSIVHAVAAAHGGTVLAEQPEASGARLTMTLAIRKSVESEVRSPILLPTDYAGGLDHAALELSDVLPDALFEQPF